MRFGLWVSGFVFSVKCHVFRALVQGFVAFRVWGLGLRVKGLGFRVSGLGFGVEGLGFRVSG